MKMENCSLLGHFIGRQYYLKMVVKWVEYFLKEELGEVPEVVGLNFGWFGFKFKK